MRASLTSSLRLGAVVLAACAAAASASSSSSTPSTGPAPGQVGEPMEIAASLGLWKSNFGAVKIEEDFTAGGPQSGFIHGVWTYQRDGRDVVGVFAGSLRGNLFDFTWQEPAEPAPLRGAGTLTFDTAGQSFRGQWWTDNRDRGGEWTGWRPTATAAPEQPVTAGDQPPPATW